MKEFIKKATKEAIHRTIRTVLLEAIQLNAAKTFTKDLNKEVKAKTVSSKKLLNLRYDIELTWKEFQEVEEIRELTLNEQKAKYTTYLETLSRSRIENWTTSQPKGPQPLQATPQYLAQEEFDLTVQDYFTVLQEDGFNIIIT